LLDLFYNLSTHFAKATRSPVLEHNFYKNIVVKTTASKHWRSSCSIRIFAVRKPGIMQIYNVVWVRGSTAKFGMQDESQRHECFLFKPKTYLTQHRCWVDVALRIFFIFFYFGLCGRLSCLTASFRVHINIVSLINQLITSTLVSRPILLTFVSRTPRY